MSVLASARELILLAVSFELMSLPLYALTAFLKEDRAASEGAIKLYLVGASSLAITLYGMSLLYGATGTTFIAEIARLAGSAPSPLVLLGLFAMLAGMTFKIGAVPFHMWVPDAYQGAFTPFVAFLSVAPKAAGFAALVRVFVEGFGELGNRFVPLLLLISALTMLVGNLLALPQTNVKRLLAYSGIAQIGTMLLGLVTLESQGLGLLLFYLVAYLFTNVGAFAVVAAVGQATGSDELSAYKGLAHRSPALALAMLVFLLSLGGIPFVAGFWAKLGVFIAAWNDGHGWLVLLGAVLAVVGIFYYLRVARCIYLEEPEAGAKSVPVPPALRLSLALSAAVVVLLGIFPGPFVDGALAAARALLG
jgi:NADH-quinone oxidoreductase subunit N